MTTLHITVGNREQVRGDALEFIQTGGAGQLNESTERAVLQFGSYVDLVSSRTSLRLELIRTIAEAHPQSMRAAARLVDRDVSDVHSDLGQLEVLGVLTPEAGGAGGAMRPVVPFDRIEMHIDYQLVGDVDVDSAPASA